MGFNQVIYIEFIYDYIFIVENIDLSLAKNLAVMIGTQGQTEADSFETKLTNSNAESHRLMRILGDKVMRQKLMTAFDLGLWPESILFWRLANARPQTLEASNCPASLIKIGQPFTLEQALLDAGLSYYQDET